MSKARGSSRRTPAHREPPATPTRAKRASPARTYRDASGHFISKAKYEQLQAAAARRLVRQRARAIAAAARAAAEARAQAQREHRNALARARRAAERERREQERLAAERREAERRERRNAAARVRRAAERQAREAAAAREAAKQERARQRAETRRAAREAQRAAALAAARAEHDRLEAEAVERERAAAKAGAAARRRAEAEAARKAQAEAEERARLEAERQAAIEAEAERKRQIEERARAAVEQACAIDRREASRSKLPRGTVGEDRLPRSEALQIIAQIEQVMMDACVCVQGLGYKVSRPVSWHYPDGSFDAELKFTPGDSAADAILEIGQCVQAVPNAWFSLQARWFPNEYIGAYINSMKDMHRDSDDAEAFVPAYLLNSYYGLIQRALNYKKATEAEAQDRVGLMADISRQFEDKYEHPKPAAVILRYFFTPDIGRPPNPDTTNLRKFASGRRKRAR